MTSARICQICGATIAPHHRFCSACGTGQTPAPTPGGTQAPGTAVWHDLLERLDRAVQPRYRILRLLGYGGMAGVYLADEPRLGRRVAIKVMAPALMIDRAYVSRFEQEARTIAQLNHANVVTVFDVDDRDGLHYFVMEFVPGRTLGQIMARPGAPLAVRALEHWFAQAASALGYAHRAGVVHRDIKPGNILVDGRGNALVTDFGIAKVADEPGLTRTGLLVGTPAYMSPEQCLGSAVTGASDQYALGIVMYELLTGAPPFTGQTVSILHAHVHEPPRPVRERRPDCPPALAAAIERMLRKEAHERFPTMPEALDAAAAEPLPEMHPLRDALNLLAATPETVEIHGELTLTRGEATRLTIMARDTAGRLLPDRPVDWVSETPAIATVDEEGVVYALAAGTVRVAAWCEGVAAVATMQVSPGEQPVELVSPRALLRPGEQVDLDARVQGERPPRVQWSSSDPRIAQVTDSGRVVALSPGAVTITASTGEHFASTTLTVSRESPPAQPAAPSPGATPAPPAPVPESLAPTPASHRPRRRRIALAAAGLTLIVIAAVTGSKLLRGTGTPASVAVVGAGDPVPEPQAASPAESETAAPDPPSASMGAAADSPRVAPTATTRVDSATTPRVRPQARPPATERTTVVPVPVPDPPRTGTLRITGALPAGAEVVVTGPDGPRTLTGGAIALVAGTYRVDVRAAGYQPVQREVEVVAGQTATWAPALQAVQPEPAPRNPAPAETISPAVAETEVRTALAGFVEALASRDLDALVRRYPGAGGTWRRQWTPFFENERDVRNLSTRLAEVRRIEVTGDVARAAFTVQMVYDDFRNRRQEPRFDFQATFRRGEGGWTLAELSQIR